MKQIALLLGLYAIIIVTVPLWGGPVLSAAQWTFTKKPAACFAAGTVSIGGVSVSSCAQWRYCSPDDSENLVNGYTCTTRE